MLERDLLLELLADATPYDQALRNYYKKTRHRDDTFTIADERDLWGRVLAIHKERATAVVVARALASEPLEPDPVRPNGYN